MLAKGELDCHASLAVRLRRAEKKILQNVVSYSASQKASAAERCEAATSAKARSDDGEVAGGSQTFHISSVSTTAGEQEFVRVNDGVQVYGTEVERAACDAEFFESVRRGDCRTGASQKLADEQPNVAVSLSESQVVSEIASLDINTSGESEHPVSAADGAGLESSMACVDVSSL